MVTPLVISVISLSLCVCCFFFCRWYITKKTAARELLADYRAEVYRLIGEIDAATDRDSLLVEERIKTLRKLMDDTDRRISVYMRELQRSRNGEAMYASLGRGIRAALDSRPLPAQGAAATPPLSTAQPVVAQAAAPQEGQLFDSGAAPLPAPKRKRKQTKAPAKKSRPAQSPQQAAAKPKIKEQIAEMSAQNLTPAEIASRLHISLAEVDLALNLLAQAKK